MLLSVALATSKNTLTPPSRGTGGVLWKPYVAGAVGDSPLYTTPPPTTPPYLYFSIRALRAPSRARVLYIISFLYSLYIGIREVGYWGISPCRPRPIWDSQYPTLWGMRGYWWGIDVFRGFRYNSSMKRAKTICRANRCNKLVDSPGFCADHAYVKEERFKSLKKAPGSREFYSGSRWTRTSLSYRRAYPLCAECKRRGTVTPVALVDHKRERLDIIAAGGNPYDWGELEGLCHACHNRKLRERQTSSN